MSSPSSAPADPVDAGGLSLLQRRQLRNMQRVAAATGTPLPASPDPLPADLIDADDSDSLQDRDDTPTPTPPRAMPSVPPRPPRTDTTIMASSPAMFGGTGDNDCDDDDLAAPVQPTSTSNAAAAAAAPPSLRRIATLNRAGSMRRLPTVANTGTDGPSARPSLHRALTLGRLPAKGDTLTSAPIIPSTLARTATTAGDPAAPLRDSEFTALRDLVQSATGGGGGTTTPTSATPSPLDRKPSLTRQGSLAKFRDVAWSLTRKNSSASAPAAAPAANAAVITQLEAVPPLAAAASSSSALAHALAHSHTHDHEPAITTGSSPPLAAAAVLAHDDVFDHDEDEEEEEPTDLSSPSKAPVVLTRDQLLALAPTLKHQGAHVQEMLGIHAVNDADDLLELDLNTFLPLVTLLAPDRSLDDTDLDPAVAAEHKLAVLYRLLDRRNDGKVDRDDVGAVIDAAILDNKLYLDDAARNLLVDVVFTKLDVTGDGVVSWHDFLLVTRRWNLAKIGLPLTPPVGAINRDIDVTANDFVAVDMPVTPTSPSWAWPGSRGSRGGSVGPDAVEMRAARRRTIVPDGEEALGATRREVGGQLERKNTVRTAARWMAASASTLEIPGSTPAAPTPGPAATLDRSLTQAVAATRGVQDLDAAPAAEARGTGGFLGKSCRRAKIYWRLEGPKFVCVAAWLALVAWWFATNWIRFTSMKGVVALFGYWVPFAKGCANVVMFTSMFLFLLVCRTTLTKLRSVRWLHWVPINKHLVWHRWCAYIFLAASAGHTLCHCLGTFPTLANDPRARAALKLPPVSQVYLHFVSVPGWTGWALVVLLAALAGTSAVAVRRKRYELFWYTHHLFVPIVALLALHGTAALLGPPQAWKYLVVPAALYAVERMLRVHRASWPVHIQAAAVQADTLELVLDRPPFVTHYVPGQYVFLQVPSISPWQWHPISLTSTDADPFLTVRIKQLGDWSRALTQLVEPALVLEDAEAEADNVDAKFIGAKSMVGTVAPSRQTTAGTADLDATTLLAAPPAAHLREVSGASTARSSLTVSDASLPDAAAGIIKTNGGPPVPVLANPRPMSRYMISATGTVKPLAVGATVDTARRAQRAALALQSIDVRVDGVFGAPSQDFVDHDHIVFIATGVGATPFLAILKDIERQVLAARAPARRSVLFPTSPTTAAAQAPTAPPRRVDFYWLNRDQAGFQWMAAALGAVDRRVLRDVVRVHAFLTGARGGQATLSSFLLWWGLALAKRRGAAGKCLLTGVRDSSVSWGRPHWPTIFRQTAALFPGKKVGVFVCGPKALAREVYEVVREVAAEVVDDGTVFAFAKENF
ncbi:NADPH oxidase 4 [Allomyces javanicus]|nr:NADPH oxidase 4 [Allomyces javanicus]